MLNQYLKAAIHQAKYKILPDDNNYFGEIEGFQGVYAQAETMENCRNELKEVLEKWVLLQLSEGQTVPTVDGLDLTFQNVFT